MATARKRATPRKSAGKKRKGRPAGGAAGRRWSAAVTRKSDALDLEAGVFKARSARGIAASLKRSAEASKRRKGTPYQSAMSMLTFYINRAGKDLPAERRRVLERAKDELRKAFGRA
jgi:Protein of unknown function (DUF3175)